MGETNSKNDDLNNNNLYEIKDDISIKRKSSILKKPKHKLVSLKSSPNLLNLGAQGYLNTIKYRKKFKKESSKKVIIKTEKNEYFFMDNSTKIKKNCSSTTDLNSFAKEKFLDDLFFLKDEENNEELNNNHNNNNNSELNIKNNEINDIKVNEVKNNLIENNINEKTNFENESDESNSSEIDAENENEFKFIYEKNYLDENNNEYINMNNENSLFIFNWDDTLHCNSYIIKKQNLSKEEKEKIKKCEKGLKKLFNITLLKGKIFVITNLDIINIETIIIKYYPSLHSILNKIEIICLKEYNHLNEKEKIYSFINQLKNENNELIKNIIFLSDCFTNDNEVSDFLKKKFSKAIIKIIKFKENPNPDELNNIFKFVNEKIDEVYNDQRNLVLKIDKN